MLGAKPTVFFSHSEKFKAEVAIPFRTYAESLGMNAILVSEMPTPERGGSDPDAKVDYYLDRADMFVALMTPDDRTEDGEVHARPNVTDEIARARTRSHLRDRIQVFKVADVDVHSNINPTHESLDLEEVSRSFPIFTRQALAWEIIREEPPTELPDRAVGPSGPPGLKPGDSHVNGALGQASAALGQLQVGLDSVESDESVDGVSVVARAHLAASVALALSRSTSPYGIHDLNGLYRERKALKLTDAEERHLLRTMILHLSDENAPGWYWFRRKSAADLHRSIVEFSLGDPEVAIRVRSLQLLSRSPHDIKRPTLIALIAAALRDGNSSIRAAGLDVLASRGDTRVIRDLGDSLDKERDAISILRVRARNTPVAALRALLARPTHLNDEMQIDLLSAARKLPLTLLREALKSYWTPVRLFALRALDRSSRLRKVDAVELMTNSDSPVQLAALRVALNRGWKLEESIVKDAVKDPGLSFMEAYELQANWEELLPVEVLSERLRWIGPTSSTTYAGLANKYFDRMATQIRDDLDDDFRSLRDAYRKEVEEITARDVLSRANALPDSHRPGPEELAALISKGVEDFFKDWDSLEEFTIGQFRIAAMRALAAHGGSEDIRFARRFGKSGDRELAKLCVQLIDRVGSAQDADLLIEVANDLHALDASAAADAALKVSANSDKAVDELLLSESRDLIRPAIASLDERPLREALEKLFPLLHSPQDQVRVAAVEYLIGRCDAGQQRSLIDIYLDTTGSYFYNVIARIDRRLYAPGWLKAAARERS